MDNRYIGALIISLSLLWSCEADVESGTKDPAKEDQETTTVKTEITNSIWFHTQSCEFNTASFDVIVCLKEPAGNMGVAGTLVLEESESDIQSELVTIDDFYFNPGQAEVKVRIHLDGSQLERNRKYSLSLCFGQIENAVPETGSCLRVSVKLPVYTVLDMSNSSAVNAIFTHNSFLTLSPTHSIQIRFYSTHWHMFGTDDPEGHTSSDRTVTYNNLMSFYNSADRGYSCRFDTDGLHLSNSVLFGDFPEFTGDRYYSWSLNRWHTLTIAANDKTCKIYDNDIYVGEYALTQNKGMMLTSLYVSFPYDESLKGYSNPEAGDFHGYLAYVRIWNKTLTPDDIRDGLRYVDPSSAGLSALWDFSSGSGSVVRDAKGKWDLDWSKCSVFVKGASAWELDIEDRDKSEAFSKQWVEWDEDMMGPMYPVNLGEEADRR